MVRQYRSASSAPFRSASWSSASARRGGYRFPGTGTDTAGFFEFEAAIGVRPNEFFWMAAGMQTFTVTDFNHRHDHATSTTRARWS
jgi:hypothetical protein